MNNLVRKRIFSLSMIGACAGLALGLAGCGDEPDVVAVAPPKPSLPPPPPAPTVTSIEQLMADMNIDSRVNLPEAKAPATDEQRRAVLEFFDALARGNSAGLRGMLVVTDQYELDEMVEAGDWAKSVANIHRIDVQTGTSPNSDDCALAVVEVTSGYISSFQPQLWYYTIEDDAVQFEAVAAPPGIMDKLSGPDWIAVWHKILEEELAKGDEPEVQIEVAQVDVQPQNQQPGRSGGAGGLSGPGGSPAPAPGNTPPGGGGGGGRGVGP